MSIVIRILVNFTHTAMSSEHLRCFLAMLGSHRNIFGNLRKCLEYLRKCGDGNRTPLTWESWQVYNCALPCQTKRDLCDVRMPILCHYLDRNPK